VRVRWPLTSRGSAQPGAPHGSRHPRPGQRLAKHPSQAGHSGAARSSHRHHGAGRNCLRGQARRRPNKTICALRRRKASGELRVPTYIAVPNTRLQRGWCLAVGFAGARPLLPKALVAWPIPRSPNYVGGNAMALATPCVGRLITDPVDPRQVNGSQPFVPVPRTAPDRPVWSWRDAAGP